VTPHAPAPVRGQAAALSLDPLRKLSRRKGYSSAVARLLAHDPTTRDLAAEIGWCAQRIGVRLELPEGDEPVAHLERAHLCRRRVCPFCEWRRTRAWRARLIDGLNRLAVDRPKDRGVFLTLTVRNCPVSELRQTLDHMHKSWGRVVARKGFPTPLWFRRTEITLGEPPSDPDCPPIPRSRSQAKAEVEKVPYIAMSDKLMRTNEIKNRESWAHPHLHVLLIVPASYFSHGYVRQTTWQQWWMESARLDYAPVVDVRRCRAKQGSSDPDAENVGAACEAAKYAAKATDLLALGPRLPELHHQLKGVRLVGVSRRLGQYVRSGDLEESELLDLPDGSPSCELSASVTAAWDAIAGQYVIQP